ncbi:alpha/beta hydrolase [Ruegeria aquimaris]|uniref:Alpha/beta hydrolase n=1 Tax=Ruegeria aquimaris TaxID=2984333 RepID=A0ABT3AE08_9RHOB|nr:alpha/beta hydrolase [Ruegeria sp. XHP0148]MCV2886902.1 alpha/beta hydrolase [Ruegeria sp. XHP0148]
MDRRSVIVTGAAALVLPRLPRAMAPVEIVLVHGAWVGGWYWQPVEARLNARGIATHAPDLPATDAAIGVDALADRLARVIKAAGGPVVLAAHSAGVRIATAAWDRTRATVRSVVMIEGPLPIASPPKVIPADTQTLEYLVVNAPGIVDAGLWPAPAALRNRYGDRIRPQSLASLTGAVVLINGALPPEPARYAVSMSDSPLAGLARNAQGIAGWTHLTLPGTHDVANSAPDALTDLLEAVAEGAGQR